MEVVVPAVHPVDVEVFGEERGAHHAVVARVAVQSKV
jgi:hypothetical protein